MPFGKGRHFILPLHFLLISDTTFFFINNRSDRIALIWTSSIFLFIPVEVLQRKLKSFLYSFIGNFSY